MKKEAVTYKILIISRSVIIGNTIGSHCIVWIINSMLLAHFFTLWKV